MLKPKPTNKEINKIQEKIKMAFEEKNLNFPHIFLKVMMDLSYSGHKNIAFRIADETWPSGSLVYLNLN